MKIVLLISCDEIFERVTEMIRNVYMEVFVSAIFVQTEVLSF